MLEVGPAHTSGDAVVHLPEAGIVFTGDVLFHGGHPIVWAGPVANWIAACDTVLALQPTIVVPGHGPLATPAALVDLKGYFEFLTSEARTRYEAGMSPLEAARDIELGPYAGWSEASGSWPTCTRSTRLRRPVTRRRPDHAGRDGRPGRLSRPHGGRAQSRPRTLSRLDRRAARQSVGSRPSGYTTRVETRTSPLIGGRYRINGLLGEGGMARVFDAFDERLDRPAAVKILRAETRALPGMRDRFQQEALIAARLLHPHIVAVLDFGEDHASSYLVMERLPGSTLRDEVVARGPLSSQRVTLVGVRDTRRARRRRTRAACCTATSSPATSSSSRTGTPKSPTSASPRASTSARRPRR